MARRVEEAAEEAEVQKPKLIGEKDFNALLRKLKAAQSKMDEAKGELGSETDKAISRHNVHKDALRVIRKYLKKDPTSQSEFIMHLDAYWRYAKLGQAAEDLVETPAERRKKIAPVDTPEATDEAA